MNLPDVSFSLPDWVAPFCEGWKGLFDTPDKRMALCIALARTNIEQKTGGPFGAAIFDTASNTLIAPGINIVTIQNSSVLHAEIIAIMLAQKIVDSYDLGNMPGRSFELVASTEPCAMCMGAVVWSGVRSLVCGAREEDASAIGFDEGPKPVHWQKELADRRISVVRDVERKEAIEVLRLYQESGQTIYNSRR